MQGAVTGGNLPFAMRYRNYRQGERRVEVNKSHIHRLGLFAREDFMPNDIVIEYVGELIDNEEADRREKQYEERGIGDCYLFRLDREWVIDATYKGNEARFLNHSCDASCCAKIVMIAQKKHILIMANKHIK